MIQMCFSGSLESSCYKLMLALMIWFMYANVGVMMKLMYVNEVCTVEFLWQLVLNVDISCMKS